MPRAISLLCGAGGDGTGLVEAGYELILGINHWQLAIDTSRPTTATPTMRASTSPATQCAGCPTPTSCGRRSSAPRSALPADEAPRDAPEGLLDLFEEGSSGEAPTKDAFERTRVTGWCVYAPPRRRGSKRSSSRTSWSSGIDWILFPEWIEAMEARLPGTRSSRVSSAHIGSETNPYAPQWRDRMYVVFTLKTMRQPGPGAPAARPVRRLRRGRACRQYWHDDGLRSRQVPARSTLPLPQHPLPPRHGRAVRTTGERHHQLGRPRNADRRP